MALPIPSYKEIAELFKKGLTLEAQEKILALREAVQGCREENFRLKVKGRRAGRQAET